MSAGSLLAAGVAAVLAAVAAASQAAAAGPQTVTLGSTVGTPTQNICLAQTSCTYVPFYVSNSNPELLIPFDGTVTSFALNAGSAGGTVELRVLRPSGAGWYTGVGTSPAETLTLPGPNTFTVSLPVKAGDVLGLDDDSSAIIFDSTSTSTSYLTNVYNPALGDGATGKASSSQSGYRLLMSAVVQQAPTPPFISGLSQSHTVWREGSQLATFARAAKPPVGTTFHLMLDQPAIVRFAFAQMLQGRRVNGRCVAQTSANAQRPSCQRPAARGGLSVTASAGAHRLFFQGRLAPHKQLPAGSYALTITATNSIGQASSPRILRFTIVAP